MFSNPLCASPRTKIQGRMFSPELLEGASFYDAHEEVGSHNENKGQALLQSDAEYEATCHTASG